MKLTRHQNAILLGLIILLALALRLWHYTGPIGSDDTSYFLGAYEIVDGTYEPGTNYWKLRYGMTLPIAASFKAFGTNEFAAAFWPMLCSLGAVAACYFLGKLVIDAATGLLAATLLAFYPLDIHYSGLILPDIPLSFLMAASVLAFLHAGKSEKRAPWLYLLSGALMAAAYSCRSMAVILLPFFAVHIVFFERKFKPVHFMMAAGFLAVMSLESVYFTLKGLGPLYNFHLNAAAALAVNASGECSTSQAYYPTVMFSKENMPVFGPYFFLFLPSMVYAAVKRERGGLTFLAWAGLLLLILQFGFVSFSPPIPMVKVRKFLNFASVPLVLTAAYALMSVKGRFRWGPIAVSAVVVTLACVSMYFIKGSTYAQNRTPEAPGGFMRQAVAYLEDAPLKPIYADRRTIGMLRLLSGFELEPDRFVDIYTVGSADELENCYLVVNWFYVRFDRARLIREKSSERIPAFLTSDPPRIPPDWKAKHFPGSTVFEAP